jgi:myosin XV
MSESNIATMQTCQQGDLVWFDAGFGFPLPGEIIEVHRAAQIIIVSAVVDGKVSSNKC